MRETEPKVHLVCRPEIDWNALEVYLTSIGARDWWEDKITTSFDDAEVLTEFAGRLCYRSFAPGLNPNVTKVRTDPKEYLQNIINSGHLSVLEHAHFTFLFQDVSRVFTHELVRHRIGGFSQESLRYVRLEELGFRIPKVLEPIRDKVVDLVNTLEEFQKKEGAYLDDEKSFKIKKEVTSALRRLAPMGLSTTILWTANLRTLMHVIKMRTAEGGEEEIKTTFKLVENIMKTECPIIFNG
jgi:thymidylate synthase (FAD)